MGRSRPAKAVDNCHFNPFGVVIFVFSLPEYMIPSFLGLINRPHAASNRIFSTGSRLSIVTLSHIDEQSKKLFPPSDIFIFLF